MSKEKARIDYLRAIENTRNFLNIPTVTNYKEIMKQSKYFNSNDILDLLKMGYIKRHEDHYWWNEDLKQVHAPHVLNDLMEFRKTGKITEQKPERNYEDLFVNAEFSEYSDGYVFCFNEKSKYLAPELLQLIMQKKGII